VTDFSTLRIPYPGLRSFHRDESDLFFGRESCVNEMVDRLARSRFLAVLGSSGSGKSSLVRTGLLSALELGVMAEAGSRWRVVDFHPGGHPLQSLASALLRGQPNSEAEVNLTEAFLRRGPRSIIEWCLDGNLAEGWNLLLLVDQFEELFRYRDYAGCEEAEAFVALLIESADAREVPIYVALTMRSEHLGACALIENLAQKINTGQFLAPRMSREQCRIAIVEPAKVCGIDIEESLVNQLLNDVADFAPWEERDQADQRDQIARRADQLPVLQHSLNQLWIRAIEQRPTGRIALTLEDYKQIGGLQGAIDSHANSILDQLGEPLKPIVEKVFRALTVGSTAAEAVRRPTRFGDLVAICEGEDAAVRAVVDAYRAPECNFLQPELRVPLQADTVVDISHESLIRQWVKLRQWAREEYGSAETYRDIERSAKQWKNGFHNLLTKLDLAEALNWRKQERPNATWAQRYGDAFGLTMDFIRKSERHRFWRRALITVAVGLPAMLVALAFLLTIYVTSHIMAALPFHNPADEFSDLGVPEQTQLRRQGALGTDTPKIIPRGQVIDTLGLKLAKKHNSLEGAPFLLINTLYTYQTIPGSIVIPYAGDPGDFHDDVQRKLGDELKDRTANNLDMPLVFYCSGAHCWHSYNACLRAINLGYTRVYWYRGGLTAWFNIQAIDVKELNFTRIEVKSSTVLKDTPEIIEIMGRVIGRVFRSAILGDHDQTVPLDDLMANSFHNRGFKYAENRAYDQAIREYDEAIKIEPKTAQFYADRGKAYYYKDQYDVAIKDFDKAIELDPNITFAYLMRGHAYDGKRDYDRAIDNYEQAIKLYPTGLAYSESGLLTARL
jgi:rhodanese-related sulfurtransferase